VDEAQILPGAFEALDRRPPGVRGAVVEDPEHALRRGVGLARHHLLGQPPEGLDPSPLLDPVEQARVVDVPGGQVGEGATAVVLELATRRPARPGGDGRVAASRRKITSAPARASRTDRARAARAVSPRRSRRRLDTSAAMVIVYRWYEDRDLVAALAIVDARSSGSPTGLR
jgi:hypothetical protein